MINYVDDIRNDISSKTSQKGKRRSCKQRVSPLAWFHCSTLHEWSKRTTTTGEKSLLFPCLFIDSALFRQRTWKKNWKLDCIRNQWVNKWNKPMRREISRILFFFDHVNNEKFEDKPQPCLLLLFWYSRLERLALAWSFWLWHDVNNGAFHSVASKRDNKIVQHNLSKPTKKLRRRVEELMFDKSLNVVKQALITCVHHLDLNQQMSRNNQMMNSRTAWGTKIVRRRLISILVSKSIYYAWLKSQQP